MRELRASGAFSDGPDPGRTCLQPVIDADITTIVQRDSRLFEPDSSCVRRSPRRDQNVAALDGSLAGVRAHDKADILSGSAAHLDHLSANEKLDFFAPENPLDLVRDIRILPAHELRPMFDNRHMATKAAVGLCQFEADIAAPEHDQMRRKVVEFQGLDICERPGCCEAGNIGDCRVRSDIDEDLIAGKHARAAVIQVHLDGLRRREAPRAHDQFGAARLIVLHMDCDLGLDHVALALENHSHVDHWRADRPAELRGVAHEMRDPRARNLVLAWHAGDVGTGAPDPSALYDGSSSSGLRHVPSQELATGSTAKDQDFKPFRLGHHVSPCANPDN